jgi:ABC-type phosphate transport system ATPase subunit
MYLGKVLEFGTTDQMFSAPMHPRAEAYITGRYG